jgi:hypothetical protein
VNWPSSSILRRGRESEVSRRNGSSRSRSGVEEPALRCRTSPAREGDPASSHARRETGISETGTRGAEGRAIGPTRRLLAFVQSTHQRIRPSLARTDALGSKFGDNSQGVEKRARIDVRRRRIERQKERLNVRPTTQRVPCIAADSVPPSPPRLFDERASRRCTFRSSSRRWLGLIPYSSRCTSTEQTSQCTRELTCRAS